MTTIYMCQVGKPNVIVLQLQSRLHSNLSVTVSPYSVLFPSAFAHIIAFIDSDVTGVRATDGKVTAQQ